MKRLPGFATMMTAMVFIATSCSLGPQVAVEELEPIVQRDGVPFDMQSIPDQVLDRAVEALGDGPLDEGQQLGGAHEHEHGPSQSARRPWPLISLPAFFPPCGNLAGAGSRA